jgi:hypothetical protein
MRKLILTTVLTAGCAVAAFGQGSVNIANGGNASPDSAATTGGQFWLNTTGTAVLMPLDTGNGDGIIWVNVLAGSSAGTVAEMNYMGGKEELDMQTVGHALGADSPLAFDGSQVPLTLGAGTVFLELQCWLGNFASYGAAIAGKGIVADSGVFQASLVVDPSTPVNLSQMPAVVLTQIPVPEPGTFALAGLGAAAMMIFRRRK